MKDDPYKSGVSLTKKIPFKKIYIEKYQMQLYRVYVYGTNSGERKEARVEAGLVCVVWWYRLQKTIRHPVTADKNNVLRVRRDEFCHTRNFSGRVDVVFGPA